MPATSVVSIAALIAVGARDMVSVNLGAFESGLLASLVGTVPAVLLGGIGALIAAGVWMGLFPALRNADRLVPVADHPVRPHM